MKLTRRDLVWIVPSGIAAAFFGWFGWRTVRIQFLKTHAELEPTWHEGERVPLGTVGELAQPWDFKYFDYPFLTGHLPAVLLRLPGPVPGGLSVGEAHFAAWSRICTHHSSPPATRCPCAPCRAARPCGQWVEAARS